METSDGLLRPWEKRFVVIMELREGGAIRYDVVMLV